MTQQTTIRQQFDRHAETYGRNPLTQWIGRSEQAAMRQLIPLAAQPGITPALDFGCGTGRLTAVLLDLGYRVTGYDLSPAIIAKATARFEGHPNLTLTTDSHVIQGTWPLITALGILDYYADPLPLWQE
jgi:predicted TPR repeat methyltransferase